MSLLLNGQEMRKRLARILEQAANDNGSGSQNDKRNSDKYLSRPGALE